MKPKMIAFILSVLFFSCAERGVIKTSEHKILRIKGSDSMLLLAQRCAEEYMKLHPDISVYVEGGGSRTGIDALINGTIDICTSSRPFQPSEVQRLVERYRSLGVATLCAKDALAIVVNPANPLSNLSSDEVKKIFTGKITQWNELGGMHRPIHTYCREPNSGTYLFLQEHVLFNEPYSNECESEGGTPALIDAVKNDTAGISYSAFAYTKNVKLLSIDGVSPTIENARNGIYPISRYLYLYTIQPPDGLIKHFIDWIISTEGQKAVQASGYIPLYETVK